MLQPTEQINQTPIEVGYTNIQVTLSPALNDIKQSLNSDITEEKKARIKEICGEKVDCIRILAGGTNTYTDDLGNTSYGSPSYEGGRDSNGLITGAVYRVAAGAVALDVYPGSKCIVGSKYPKDELPAPNIVMSKELLQLGISPERLIVDPDTLDTIAEIVGLIEISTQEGFENLVIVTSDYHCARVKAILSNLDWLLFPNEKSNMLGINIPNIKVVSAEEILKVSNPEVYNTYIEDNLTKQEHRTRLANEENGIEMLKRGIYSRCDPITGERRSMQAIHSNLQVNLTQQTVNG